MKKYLALKIDGLTSRFGVDLGSGKASKHLQLPKLLILLLFWLAHPLEAMTDSLEIQSGESPESAADVGQRLSLETLYQQQAQPTKTWVAVSPPLRKTPTGQHLRHKLQKQLRPSAKRPSQSSERVHTIPPSKLLKEKAKEKLKKQRAERDRQSRRFHWFSFKFLDLDWLLVGIALGAFFALIVLLHFLLTGSVLTIFEMLLFALGFAGAIFAFVFLLTESNLEMASYDYFVKYGIFTWPGLLAIIAGFAGLFGGGGSFLGFLLVGLVLGGIAFLISLLLGDSILDGFE